MALVNRKIVTRGNICNLTSQELSDGSLVYDVGIHNGWGECDAYISADSEEHAVRIFDAIESNVT